MSDPRLNDPRIDDPLIPPTAGRQYVPRSDRVYDDRPGGSTMWGIIIVVALLIAGGLYYYETGPHVASTGVSPPISTTGAAPQPNPRPVPQVPPAPPTRTTQ